ncbi:MAG: hypothetical protein AB1582_23280 [Pseudomonadota bacterium]
MNSFQSVTEPIEEDVADLVVAAQYAFERPPAIQEFHRVMRAEQIEIFPLRTRAFRQKKEVVEY